MTDELPSYRYRAVAMDNDGVEVVEVFESNVEVVAGDDLTFHGADWHVDSVEQEGIAHMAGDDQKVRVLYCVRK
jgi:hypothetical protein